jgi:hypothetical protein
VFRPAQGPTKPPLQWYRLPPPGVNRPGCEVDHSTPCSAEVKNKWSYTSTTPHVFVAWYLVSIGDLYARLKSEVTFLRRPRYLRCLVGCIAGSTYILAITFRRNVPLPSSGLQKRLYLRSSPYGIKDQKTSIDTENSSSLQLCLAKQRVNKM